jgi:nucleotide-binding universal stress UspA family protein
MKSAGESEQPLGDVTMAAILVPLDGSDLASAAVRYAAVFAGDHATTVVLLAVVDEGARSGGGPTAAEARAYLEATAEPLRTTGLAVQIEVRFGRPADEIDAAADELAADLIVMSTHGRTGVARWVRGSVADAVLRRGSTPVLAINTTHAEGAWPPKRIAVPLDGSPEAENTLDRAHDLAVRFDADLDLVRVIAWPPYTGEAALPLTRQEVEAELEGEALDYLETVRERMAYPKAHGVVLRGSAADELVAYASGLHVDLFVMSAHGHGGLIRMALGSVTDRLIAAGIAPVLVERSGAVQAHATRRRRCFACGRLAPPRDVMPTDLCIRCGRHLHVCDNCVFFTGSLCLRDRPEVLETPRGQTCPEFLFRETPPKAPGGL